MFDESAEKTSNKVNELSNRLEATNLQSDSEDEIQIIRNNTSDSHLNQTYSADSPNGANRTSDQSAVQ